MPKVPTTFTLNSLCFQSGNVLAKKMTANTFVMVFWREICLVPQVIFSICQCVVCCLLLSISALYFIACVCSMLRHSSTVDRIRSPATSFLSLQSGKTIKKQFDLLSESKFKIGHSSRAIGDALNMMCHFYALNVLPLGDVMMIAAVRVTFPRHQKSLGEEGGIIWKTPESRHIFSEYLSLKIDS